MKRLLILATLLAIMSTLIGCSTPPSTEPSSKPTTAPQAVAPTATPQAAAPTATPQAVAPTDTPQAVAPTDTPQVSEPTATAQAETTDSTASDEYTVNIDPADFVDVIDNPYLPFLVGSKHVYEGTTQEGLERIELEVLPEKREIMGIQTTIVRDRVTINGELFEDTFDWFAQDKDGNVWVFGEEVTFYENGQVLSTEGSWEAGVDGALPGIAMYADPAAHVGETYRIEYYPGEAVSKSRTLLPHRQKYPVR